LIDDKIANVGDTLFGIFKNTVSSPFADDLKPLFESWKKRLDTNCKIFLPGHGKEISQQLLQKEYNKYATKQNDLIPINN
jgi:glyoxylase-like metal-dependent hydrolase (beta-lactamase superfamily II)